MKRCRVPAGIPDRLQPILNVMRMIDFSFGAQRIRKFLNREFSALSSLPMSGDDSVLDISASDEDFDDGGIADTDINGQIKHMVAQNPQFSKWMVMSLQLMKQKEKKQRANAKREEKKAAKENLKRRRDDFTDYDDSGADSDTLKNRKKGKKKAEPDSDGEVTR
ncbi:hypothetical protein B0H13DRAFT_1851499 [Mycena leptocephala]|nr:hypothetical protein B0H13DRAFT_1851499 [Mycena leptocephala]